MINQLSLDQLTFERDDTPIFEGLTAHWQSGDIVQLTGENGSGKTTLLRCIAGLTQCQSGSILWNDISVNSTQFRYSMLYLGHQVAVKESMTPFENLRWYFALNGSKAQHSAKNDANADLASGIVPDEQLKEALATVGLHLYMDVPCYQLSAGQKRRVALARLYCSHAPLWLLDEPFTAIDKAGVSALEKRIEEHAQQGGIVILTTHQQWHVPALKLLNIEHFRARYTGDVA